MKTVKYIKSFFSTGLVNSQNAFIKHNAKHKMYYPKEGRCLLLRRIDFRYYQIPKWAKERDDKYYLKGERTSYCETICYYKKEQFAIPEKYRTLTVVITSRTFRRAAITLDNYVVHKIYKAQLFFAFCLCIRKRLPKDIRKIIYSFLKGYSR